MQLADRLGVPLQELQRKTSSTDFYLWKAYMDYDLNAFHREDHYLAQIAATVRAGQVKPGTAVSSTDFIIKFVRKEEKPPTTEEVAVKTTQSKNYWKALAGMFFSQKPKLPPEKKA